MYNNIWFMILFEAFKMYPMKFEMVDEMWFYILDPTTKCVNYDL